MKGSKVFNWNTQIFLSHPPVNISPSLKSFEGGSTQTQLTKLVWPRSVAASVYPELNLKEKMNYEKCINRVDSRKGIAANLGHEHSMSIYGIL